MYSSLPDICAQLRQCGSRRLLVLSGENTWVEQQLTQIKAQLSGDWLTLSSHLSAAMLPEKAHLLLGREYTHAIFDARSGFHSEAFAILAGTLKAGSLLVVCTPPQEIWPQSEDVDSVRWNEQLGIISTPNFIHHIQRIIKASPQTLIYQQGQEPQFALLTDCPTWQSPTGQPTQQQQFALNQMLSTTQSVEQKIWGIIAARGRGKSTVAGMLIQQWQGECWCCAPAKVATQVLEQYAGKSLTFCAPDTLLQYCQRGEQVSADWLIIDEAATIPTYILRQIITYFPRVLMTTTVDGYEGTGRGFINKFCVTLNHFTALTLNEPIRFARNDPLENWLNQALLLSEPPQQLPVDGNIQLEIISQSQLANNAERLSRFYGLLTSAHYRTSPLDLRRLLDAQNQYFSVARVMGDHYVSHQSERYVGALWMISEGKLDEALSWQVWAGLRRPRGNLVAQSLAAHSYFPSAAQMSSRRVMRIAVESAYRRKKIGFQLIELQKKQAQQQGLDYLSVSFGLTPELLAFWQAAGFGLVRIGSHKEASSGCFSAMAIMPISVEAQKLYSRADYLLQRDLFWRNDLNEFNLKSSQEQSLTTEDWMELIGFSQYSRPMAASSAAIQRLLMQDNLIKPPSAEHQCGSQSVLALYFRDGLSIAEICTQVGLAGQKQWIKQARLEVGLYIRYQQLELTAMIEQKFTISYP